MGNDQTVQAYAANKKNLETILALQNAIKASAQDTTTVTEETNTHLEKTNRLSNSLIKAGRDISESFKNVAMTLTGIESLRGFTNMATNLVKSNTELYRLGINAGKGAAEGQKLQNVVIGLRTGFGATREQAQALVETFSKNNFAGDIEKASQSAYQFARATKQDMSSIADLTTELSRSAGLSDKAITASYASILKVQQTNGITDKGIQAINSSIVESSFNMKAFGKSSEAIKGMITNTAKLVSSMEKVGIAASTAVKLVDKLTDPGKIKDNIAAYSALGISMSEALSGGDITGQIETGMKEFGQKVKSMGVIAGSAYAEAMGITYKDAIKAADLQSVTEDVTISEDSSEEALKTLTEQTKDLGAKLQDFGNKLMGTFEKFGPVFLMLMGTIVPLLTASISNAIKNGIEKGAEEGSRRMTTTVATASKEMAASMATTFKSDLNKEYAALKDMRREVNSKIGTETYKKEKEALDAITEEFKNKLKNVSSEFKIKIDEGDIEGSMNKIRSELSKREGNQGPKVFGTKMNDLSGKVVAGIKGIPDAIRNIPSKIESAWTSFRTHTDETNTSTRRTKTKTNKKGGGIGGLLGKLGIFAGIFALLTPLLNDLVNLIKQELQPTLQSFTPAIDLIKNVISNVAKSLAPVLKDVAERMMPIFGTFAGILGDLLSLLAPLIEGVMPLITTLMTALIPILKFAVWILKGVVQVITWVSKILNFILTPLRVIGEWLSKDSATEALQENTEATNRNTQSEKSKLFVSNGAVYSTSNNITENNSSSSTTSSSSSVTPRPVANSTTIIKESTYVKKIQQEFTDFRAEFSKFLNLLEKEFTSGVSQYKEKAETIITPKADEKCVVCGASISPK